MNGEINWFFHRIAKLQYLRMHLSDWQVRFWRNWITQSCTAPILREGENQQLIRRYYSKYWCIDICVGAIRVGSSKRSAGTVSIFCGCWETRTHRITARWRGFKQDGTGKHWKACFISWSESWRRWERRTTVQSLWMAQSWKAVQEQVRQQTGQSAAASLASHL